MANYELYQVNGTTPVAIVQPIGADWVTATVGTFADFSERTSRYHKVIWRFAPISEAQLNIIRNARLAGGKMYFKTWREDTNTYVKCFGVMRIVAGVVRDGERVGVRLTWTRVEL